MLRKLAIRVCEEENEFEVKRTSSGKVRGVSWTSRKGQRGCSGMSEREGKEVREIRGRGTDYQGLLGMLMTLAIGHCNLEGIKKMHSGKSTFQIFLKIRKLSVQISMPSHNFWLLRFRIIQVSCFSFSEGFSPFSLLFLQLLLSSISCSLFTFVTYQHLNRTLIKPGTLRALFHTILLFVQRTETFLLNEIFTIRIKTIRILQTEKNYLKSSNIFLNCGSQISSES